MNYAMVNEQTSTIDNIVIFDGPPSFEWPGYDFVADPDGVARIGGSYIDGVFLPPPEEQQP